MKMELFKKSLSLICEYRVTRFVFTAILAFFLLSTPACADNANVGTTGCLLKMDGRTFAVEGTSNSVPWAFPTCFHTPVEVTHFAAQSHFDSKSEEWPQILADYARNSQFNDPFDEVQNNLSQAHIKLNDLPQDNGFYVWKRKSFLLDRNYPYAVVYIAVDHKLLSPNGKPAVFECLDPTSIECDPRIQIGKIIFRMRFVTSVQHIPVLEWKGFYGELKRRVQQWEDNASAQLHP